jgi:hypothetical protein
MGIPLSISTDGYLCGSGSTLAIVSNGYLCTITVSPPIKPPSVGSGLIGGGFSYFSSPNKMWLKPTGDTKQEDKVKLITVKVIKNGIEYIQEKYITDLSIEAKDVKFELLEEKNDIKIKIYFDK